MGAMSGAERVVDVDLGQRGKLLAELRVVLFLAFVEAQVLEQQHVAIAQRDSLRLSIFAHRVGGENDRLAQQFGQTQRRRTQAERLFEPGARRTA